MPNDILISLSRLSDDELVGQLKTMVARDHDTEAQIVARLAELDTRDVHLREGYSSLFVYCRDALGLSEWEAYARIEVARTARRFPVILELLAAGEVNLTTVKLLAAHLTPANHREVLESARRKKKLGVEEIVARLRPKPDVPTSIRRVSTPLPPHPAPPPMPLPASGDPVSDSLAVVAPHTLWPAPPAAVKPLSPDRYKLQITIGGETLEKLRLAKDMLGHAIPSGDDAAVLDRALTALLVVLAKKKFADTPNPRTSRGKKAGAREPAARVKRAAWVRDLGRCAFVGTNGHRCNERRFLEFHHLDPYVLGGEATVDLIELRCRRHNNYEATLYFGRHPRGRAGVVREQAVAYRSMSDVWGTSSGTS